MFLIYKYCHNFEPGVLLSKNLINEVMEMADMLPVVRLVGGFIFNVHLHTVAPFKL